MSSDVQRRALLARVIAALRLQVPLYVEVSTNRNATGQAFLVVLLSGVSNGAGLARLIGAAGISVGVGAAVLGWFLWTAVVYVIGGMLGRRQPGRSLLRALGFATAPGLFLVLGTLPWIGALARATVVVWLLAATAVAVRAVYDVSRRRAVLVSVAAFVLYLVIGGLSAYWASG